MRYLLLFLSMIVITGCASKESRCEKAVRNRNKIILSNLPEIARKAAAPSKKKLAKNVKSCVAKFNGPYVDCIAKAKSNGDLAKCVTKRMEKKIRKSGSKLSRKAKARAKKVAKKNMNKVIDQAIDGEK